MLLVGWIEKGGQSDKEEEKIFQVSSSQPKQAEKQANIHRAAKWVCKEVKEKPRRSRKDIRKKVKEKS